jgi:23S rRNA (cytidine1920-2'-O)/16S rRNA (cytidine1409-2'-O)-methyltransferase
MRRLAVTAMALALAAPAADLVALVKPQFEVGRVFVGKRGIVRDKAASAEAVARAVAYLQGAGWRVLGTLPSPILGQDGNEETLAGAVLD